MRLEQLAYLIEISKNASLTSASENLFITPQALSTAIKTLEKELGVPLLIRSNKGTHLTAHGKKICGLAGEIMTKVDEINLYCLKNTGHAKVKGTLKIASSPPGAAFILPKILFDFTATYQNIDIVMAECANETIIEGVAEKRYDLGLVNANYEFLAEKYHDLADQLKFLELFSGKLSIFCSKHSPVYTMKNISWEKACTYPMVLSITDNVNAFNIYGLGRESPLPHKTYNYSNAMLCIDTIVHTDFIGVAIDKSAQYLPETLRSQVRTVPLKENISNGFYFVTATQSDEISTALLNSVMKP